MSIVDKISKGAELTALSFKSIVKLIVESRRCTVKSVAAPDEALIVMGNGPSLADTIAQHGDVLERHPLMAVNYASRSKEFFELRPQFYTMIDPAFFDATNENATSQWHTLAERVDWPLTIFVPARAKVPNEINGNTYIKVERVNPVGVEGFEWLEDWAFASGRGMPRPRNVLIASLMVGLKLGFKTIYVVGADHSWTANLAVNDRNELIAIEKHFYEESADDRERIATIYRGVRMHQMMHSLYVAFKSYFAIERFAAKRGVKIYNATPVSFIDAFERKALN